MHVEEEIIICGKCKGKGITEESKLVGGHNNDYDYWNEICSKRKGSGRLLKIVETQTTIKEYSTPKIEKK